MTLRIGLGLSINNGQGTNGSLSQTLDGAILTEDLASYFSFTENDYLQAA